MNELNEAVNMEWRYLNSCMSEHAVTDQDE